MESNVREREGSEQCQDVGDQAMGESGNMPCAQKDRGATLNTLKEEKLCRILI